MAVYENAKAITAPKTSSFQLIFVCLLILAQLACGLSNRVPTSLTAPSETPVSTPVLIETYTPFPTPLPIFTLSPFPTSSPTEIFTPTQPFTPTPTPSPTQTLTPSITPTYAILRGQVIPERANCRYGPGWMYLYKYGLVGGSNLDVIGRTDLGDWVLIQAIGGNNPCWVRADLMDIQGEVITIAPVDVHVILPWSPYYTPLTNVSAVRIGETVTVSWSPLVLRAGDQADPVAYVLEAWVCRDGELVFVPDGSFEPVIEIVDETGCDEPSHGRVMAAEKHGYTLPVEILWP